MFFPGSGVSVVTIIVSVTGVSAQTVNGSVDQNVTLPCRYSVTDHGVTTMCWGRGEPPLFGCNNLIISTDGQSVNSRLSERHQLLGQLTGGDVSLTILHAQESDSGLYGCRVKVPGWFNDQKHTVNLIV
uniref:Ig-like domain-containing protein n=1 Tax=Lepisosteus oculatus TaxID=7918 RepID=W5MT76_LEPOC